MGVGRLVGSTAKSLGGEALQDTGFTRHLGVGMRTLLMSVGVVLLVGLAGCMTPHDRSSDDWISQLIEEIESEQTSQAKAPVAAKPAPSGAASVERPSARPAPPTAEMDAVETEAPGEAVEAAESAEKAGDEVAEMPFVSDALVGDVLVQPDSIVSITVKEDPSLDGHYRVNDFGAIDFGFVGLVILNSMTAEQAEAQIKSLLESRYLKVATVTAKIAKASYDRVQVGGEVVRPGALRIGPGTAISLHDALLRSGGVRPNASKTRVKVVSGGMRSPFGPAAEGEVYELMDADGRPWVPDVQLRDSDFAYIYSSGSATPGGDKSILVLGEVSRPGPVRFASGEPCTVMYLLFKIGGLPRFAKANAIKIVRRDSEGNETEIVADGQRLMKYGRPEDDIALENGDTVVVPYRGFSLF